MRWKLFLKIEALDFLSAVRQAWYAMARGSGGLVWVHNASCANDL
jgi:hypothetical protein